MGKMFSSAFEYKLIYIFEIKSESHKGLLKIGDTTIQTDDSIDNLPPNCRALNQAAIKRIREYTNTAGISFDLLHTELAIRTIKDKDGRPAIKAFRDHHVHRVLENSGIPKKKFKNSTSQEWFDIDLSTALKAIEAVKKGHYNLSAATNDSFTPIIFRPEQEDAINRTLKQFKSGNRMLWNAKMRFGKTLSALEVVKRSKFEKTIIITHRPVVDSGWYEDFNKIFYSDKSYIYGSKNTGYTIEDLLKTDKIFVYFASMQDLRGSDLVGGKFDKNDAVFDTVWDFVIVDEAHEGTTTALGNDVIKATVKEELNKTKFLALSGTPFNILGDYDDNIYTWDYVMEQSSKYEWDKHNLGDSNPYAELPELKIYTYDLGKLIDNPRYKELEDKAFNFREFFRVWTGDMKIDRRPLPSGVKAGEFFHKADVWSFLNLITKKDEDSQYPYSTEEYRSLFRHSLWMVPGVKEAKALSQMMKNHPVFGNGAFNIVNVAGDGDEEEKSEDALEKVQNAIKSAGNEGYTITLSCGKLTTGVTVPEWTAVFYLAGSFSTSAANYLQTIFRVQSPCNKDGKIKTTAYVFDFAPDRTLKMVAESVAISTKAGKTDSSDRLILGEFLNYCPVIAVEGTSMKEYDTNRLLQQLKRAYAERAVKNGFDDNNLYNDELLKLDNIDLENFKKLKGIIGSSKSSHKTNEIDVNRQGFTDEEYEEIERLKKKPKKERTPEEEAKLKEANEKRKQARDARSILRGISIRMPLLIYGADIDINEDITMEKLVEIVDDSSWEEFMPVGVTKEIFKQFIKYYDPEIFVVAGRKIRDIAKGADELPPTERIKQIAELFLNFKNPDKETVLTPWRVVNMHMGDCLGGYNFYDEKYNEILEEPRYIDQGQVTEDTLSNKNAKILEINSKTGLYPLYVAYSIYRKRCEEYSESDLTKELEDKLWEETIKENIFIICKTPMAKSITKRTLLGFKDISPNATYFDDLNNMMRNKSKQFINRITRPNYWKKKGSGKMKFDAVVGNPPYQENISDSKGNTSLSRQLFPVFIQNSILIKAQYVSLITPARWFTGDAQDKSFVRLRDFIRENNHICKLYYYEDEKELFNNVEIKGGLNYFLYDINYNGKVEFVSYEENGDKTVQNRNLFEKDLDIIISNGKDYPILQKVKARDFVPLTTMTTGRNPFGIIGKESNVNKVSKENRFPNSTELRCKGNNIRYINPDIITKNREIFESYKVFISKSAGNPKNDMNVIGRPYLGKPFDACTDSLITIGKFDTLLECENLAKYLRTKFLRFMVSILKISQNVTQIVYEFVPLQDFTGESDIDWDKSIKEIDMQLYQKYDLSQEEIDYIENKIKEMD
ncbi:Eco57I restriction-modification methylase domain-containing protein [Clostridium tyrobutyricum]|uniref:Eco57I restriction-modification methylase domain-containing protein n=1 Tax=Clostridium tyrobutyricum TaxID=1519 RepID=UPI0039F66425